MHNKYYGRDCTRSCVKGLESRLRSNEILRIAKEMADKQHIKVVKKLEAAPISKRTRNKILRSLKTRTR